MKVESYKCDVCRKTMDKGQLRFLLLPVKTQCNWTDGMPEAEHIEFVNVDVCEKCLEMATNLRADFQGSNLRIEYDLE